jgi:hypothetical protein
MFQSVLVSAALDYLIFLILVTTVGLVVYTILKESYGDLSRRRRVPRRLAARAGGSQRMDASDRSVALWPAGPRHVRAPRGGPHLPVVPVLRVREPGLAGREVLVFPGPTCLSADRAAFMADLKAHGLTVDELQIEQS